MIVLPASGPRLGTMSETQEFSEETKRRWKEEEYERRLSLPKDDLGFPIDNARFLLRSKIRECYLSYYAAEQNVTLEDAKLYRCHWLDGFQTEEKAREYLSTWILDDQTSVIFHQFYIVDRYTGQAVYDPI